MHPDYPPRARIEWVIAGARVVLAVGSLLAIWLDPTTPPANEPLTYTLLGIYLLYSVAALALVWKPVEFSRVSGLAGHLFDLTAFVVFMALTEGASSPFFVYFVFAVISGALRWESKGALLTAAAALSAYGGIGIHELLTDPAFETDRFVFRALQLTVLGALLAYLSSYHPRTLREVLRFASWPHLLPPDERDVIVEIVERANEVLPAPRVLLLWRQRDEDVVNGAWSGEGGIQWIREPRTAFEPMVPVPLRNASFQARDASDSAGRVDYWQGGRFRALNTAPVHESLRQRFRMHAVQSARFDGGVVEGRLFWLDRRRMQIDDLVVGDLVARLAAARLESAFLLASFRETAALGERLRIARDLHDSVLQAMAGTGVQVAIAKRLFDRDPAAARHALGEVQQQLEQGEKEMRALIRKLRPRTGDTREGPAQPFASRLQAFSRRIEAQWQVRVLLDLAPAAERLDSELADQVVLLVQEAVLNAAKHADASTIRAVLESDGQSLTLTVADDGKGFAFTGSFDLADLAAAGAGPLTLRERVMELGGHLHIQSAPSGATVRISMPLTKGAAARHGDFARPR